MAASMPGPIPKPPGQRARRNVDPVPLTAVCSDGQVRGPGLPGDREWHPRTVAWWETWRRSPQAQAWGATDWDFLADTAILHDRLWERGDVNVMPELRLRVAKMGATMEDRLKLRLSVQAPAVAAPAAAAPGRRSARSRRSRLLKAVDAATG